MSKVEQLVELLKRLNAGEDVEKVKQEAEEFLSSISPADLSIAEQQLLAAGLDTGALRNLCSVHLGLIGPELEKLRGQVKPGHVIHTLVAEHDLILGFLDELEKANLSVQGLSSYDPEAPEFETLKHVADHLVGAEAHHKREEDVLFPALEEKGVFGPPQVMRQEHDELRAKKHELQELVEGVSQANFAEFRKRLDAVARFIVPTLRDHIFKENNVLYPTALQVIRSEEQWAKMKQACDAIGYCCFTPEV